MMAEQIFTLHRKTGVIFSCFEQALILTVHKKNIKTNLVGDISVKLRIGSTFFAGSR